MAAARFGWCLNTIMPLLKAEHDVMTRHFFWHCHSFDITTFPLCCGIGEVHELFFFYIATFYWSYHNFCHYNIIMIHIWHCIMFIAFRDSFEVAIYLFGILVYYSNMLLAFQYYLRLWDSFDITTVCHTIHLQLSFGNIFWYQIVLILW